MPVDEGDINVEYEQVSNLNLLEQLSKSPEKVSSFKKCFLIFSDVL